MSWNQVFSEKFAKNVVEVKPEVVVYFGLLSILTQVGVAQPEKRVAAIFLLPVWALEPPKRSFRPYSGSYGCLMAGRRPKMLRNPRRSFLSYRQNLVEKWGLVISLTTSGE